MSQSLVARIPACNTEADDLPLPPVEYEGQRYTALEADASPPLLVGIFSATGALVDLHRLTDPRVEFCRQINGASRPNALTARPLEAIADDIEVTLPLATPTGLTDREIAVLKMIGEGMANKAIAKALDCGLRTVESSRAAAGRKLCLDPRALVLWVAVNRQFLD